MLFNSSITVYQKTQSFEHGESNPVWASAGTLYCHIKFTGNEQMSADRKKAIRRARVTFETFPVALTARDVLAINGVAYHLQYTPTPRVGLGGRTIYEVDVLEDFKGEVSL